MQIFRAVYFLFKGLYDLFVTYLLGWVLLFAVVAFGLHQLADQLASGLGFGQQRFMWASLGDWFGITPHWTRLGVFGFGHILFYVAMRKPIGLIKRFLERTTDDVSDSFDQVQPEKSLIRTLGGLIFSVVVTVLVVPFVIQPTIVPLRMDVPSWTQRAANLVDGTASDAVVESAVGLYRKIYASRHDQGAVATQDDFDRALDAQDVESKDHDGPTPAPKPVGKQPMMDRWNPLIWEAVGGNPEHFAMTKAFMWVESAGRQFAVSHTGCSGLMQFCAGTARSEPYREIFGFGEVYVCGCQDTRCRVDKAVQRAMETGGQAALDAHEDDFPCDLTDARFNAERSIRAGALYAQRLAKSFGGNIYLMYVGYNSGPGIARRIWRKTGQRADVTIEAIQAVLVDALRPNFGDRSKARAKALGGRTLPKVGRAYRRYLSEGRAMSLQSQLRGSPSPDSLMTMRMEDQSRYLMLDGSFGASSSVANGVN